jgi:serine O-acetyltransferase
MRFEKMKESILNDLYRYHGKTSMKIFLKSYFLIPGFNYMVWLRLGQHWNNAIIKYMLHRKKIKYGIQISIDTKIGKGFYIGHFGGIVISGGATIGDNCNISQDVTIGLNPRGKNKGAPIIGDNCYIAPGVKIIGNVKIGNNVAIGANAVVTADLPDNAVAVGIPARIISYNGSEGYTNNRV